MKPWKALKVSHPSALDERFHPLNIETVGNVLYWYRFFGLIRDVPGDIVECGIGRARSLLVLACLDLMLEEGEGGGRQIYGYDSFEGFPEPTPEDASHRRPQKGEWARSPSGKYEYTEVFTREVLKLASCDGGHITLRKGVFGDSLRGHPAQPIALLHLDGDLYQSYKVPLDLLFRLLSIGGVVVFDDIWEEDKDEGKFPGSRKAVKEFFGVEYERLEVSIGGTMYYTKHEGWSPK